MAYKIVIRRPRSENITITFVSRDDFDNAFDSLDNMLKNEQVMRVNISVEGRSYTIPRDYLIDSWVEGMENIHGG